MLASQPEPQKRQSIIAELMTKRVVHVAAVAESTSCDLEKLSVCSFSQPVTTEYGFLSSQISSTPCRSQVVMTVVTLVEFRLIFHVSIGVISEMG